jgi:CheY-like chemotaxis protein/phosphoribosyl 1,2-cyclic phosphodiesterase
MRVKFWGTRGSIATPGPDTVRFGGNTSCVEICTGSGARFLIDCGTGARLLGQDWLKNAAQPIHASILISHTHWDHIQGFPFFAPLFVPGNEFAIYAPQGGGRSLHAILAGQMEFTYFPVDLEQLPAKLRYYDLGEGTHQIGGVQVEAQYLNHPASTLGYRVEADGVAVVYLADHEPFGEQLWMQDSPRGKMESILHEGDRRHARFMAGADLVIHDAQYTPAEYPAKKNWGHSTYEYAAGVATAAGVRKLALTHHDPTHDDAFLDNVEKLAGRLVREWGSSTEVICAREGLSLEVVPAAGRKVADPVLSAAHAGSSEGSLAGRKILVVDDDDVVRQIAVRALEMGGYIVHEASGGDEAIRQLQETSLDLILLDVIMPPPDGLEVLKAIRSSPQTANLPVMLFTAHAEESSALDGFAAGATDYLAKPFTVPQLLARVRACLMRV